MKPYSPKRYVDFNALTHSQKKMIWRGIQTLDPALANTIKRQKNKATAEKRAFVMPYLFTAADINKYTEASQNNLHNNQGAKNVEK